MEYVEYGIHAGLDVDEFAPRLSFFFNAHNDFFEEIAKFRAARRIWATVDARALRREGPALLDVPLPHADGRLLAHRPAAVQQRRPHDAPGARRGPRRDEVAPHQLARRDARAADREARRRIALRTQQIIAHESGVINTVDPLGGSYFVEELTDRMEQGCFDYFRRIDELGGMVEAIEAGFPQREIMDAAYAYQRAVETGEKIIVGVNDFTMENEAPLETLYIDESVDGRADRPARRRCAASATRRGRGHARAPRGAARSRRQHHAAASSTA